MGFISQVRSLAPRSWSSVLSELREMIMTVCARLGAPSEKRRYPQLVNTSGYEPQTDWPNSLATTPTHNTQETHQRNSAAAFEQHNGLNQLGRSSLRRRKEELPDDTDVDQSEPAKGDDLTNQRPLLEIMEGRSPPADTLFMLVNEMMSGKISFGGSEVSWSPGLWSRKMLEIEFLDREKQSSFQCGHPISPLSWPQKIGQRWGFIKTNYDFSVSVDLFSCSNFSPSWKSNERKVILRFNFKWSKLN